MTKGKKLLFFVSEDWYFCSHRLPLALAAKQSGYDVTVITRVTMDGEQITSAGLKLIPFDLSRRGMNPFVELIVIFRLLKIYHSEKPCIVHHIALKPVIYGTIASILASVPKVVNTLAGLGFVFSSRSIKARVLRPFIKIVFRLLLNRKNNKLILQNPNDVQLMLDNHIVLKERIKLIRGSGVDLKQYDIYPEQSGTPIIILASRLLWDKGVGEFVRAAESLKQSGVDARFVIVGKPDDENPTAISVTQLQAWHDTGIVEWWGHKDNMPDIFAQSHIVCLPSFYGEGVPKVLIEAASCGRPIVTTDTPGCREIVRDNVNGILVPIKNSEAVANAISRLLKSSELRTQMGKKGRELVEKEFSLDIVNRETLNVYKDLYQ